MQYHKEREAFLRTWSPVPSTDIVRYYGAFTHGDSHNLILEFADKGDLEYHFHNARRPRNPEDILKVWKGLRRLLYAVMKLHGADKREECSRG